MAAPKRQPFCARNDKANVVIDNTFFRPLPLLLAAVMLSSGLSASEASSPPPLTVEATKIKPMTLKTYLPIEGRALATRRVNLQFDRPGKIIEIGKEPDTGDEIREGSLVKGPVDGKPGTMIARLADIDVSEQLVDQAAQANAAKQRAAAAKTQVQQAEADFQAAKEEFLRTEKLVNRGVIPRIKLSEAQKAVSNAQTALTRIKANLGAAQADLKAAEARAKQASLKVSSSYLQAPFDGVIAHFNVGLGDAISPLSGGMSDTQLTKQAAAVLVDPSSYEIVTEVPTLQALEIKRDQPAEITWGGLGIFNMAAQMKAAGKTEQLKQLPIAQATVWSVAPAVLPDSRTVRVKLRTTAGAEHLSDGYYVAGRIESSSRENVLALPRQSLSFDGNTPYVYVVDKSGTKANRTTVAVGMGNETHVEILSGVSEGQWVVTQGQTNLTDGAGVKIVKEVTF